MTPGAATERRWTPSWPIDLGTTLEVLQHGRYDPTLRLVDARGLANDPDPGRTGDRPLRALGGRRPGDRLGTGRRPRARCPARRPGRGRRSRGLRRRGHPVMAAAHERFGRGWRVLRTTRVLEALVPAVLEQRVTGLEASRAWAELVRGFGEPAPGPAFADRPMLVAPDGAGWARIPSWAWHRAGSRSRTGAHGHHHRSAGRSARAPPRPDPRGGRRRDEVAARDRGLDRGRGCRARPRGRRRRLLRRLPPRPDDRASPDRSHRRHRRAARRAPHPWAGQRARAVRLLQLHGGKTLPRRAPRATITDHRRW